MFYFPDLCMDYMGGRLPPWFYKVFLSTRTVALWKDKEQESVRPLGIRHPILRTLHRMIVTENKVELRDYLEPQRLALSPGGCNKLYFSLRMTIEQRPDFAFVKLDCTNAFNCTSRAKIVQSYSQEPSLSHMSAQAAISLAPATPLEERGVVWGEGSQGAAQGDSRTSPDYCVAWQPYIVELDDTVKPHGGLSLFIMDDGYVGGPPHILFPVILRFEQQIREECNLTLQRSKCEVYTQSGDLPEDALPGFIKAGEEVDGQNRIQPL